MSSVMIGKAFNASKLNVSPTSAVEPVGNALALHPGNELVEALAAS